MVLGFNSEPDVIGFPDTPLSNDAEGAADDLLGLDKHAEALAKFIRRCDTPMTVGLQGGWGTGKTSLMNLIQRKLGDKVPAINFNTWQYSQFAGEEHLGISLLQNLALKLHELATDAQSLYDSVKESCVKVAAGTAGIAQQILKTQAGLSADEDIGAHFEKFDFSDSARAYEELRDDFSELVSKVVDERGASKVAFYIDDLDRLPPVRAIELLEVIKNFVTVDGCVFVLAVDYEIIKRGLRQRKGYELEDRALAESRSFFDKIIQVPYRMPTATYESDQFLIKNFQSLHPEADTDFIQENARAIIEASVGHNPRSIKRLLNLHKLLTDLTELQVEAADSELQARDLVVPLFLLTCIQNSHFRFYRTIAGNHDVFDALLVAAVGLGRLASEHADQLTEGNIGDIVSRVREAVEDDYEPLVESEKRAGALNTAARILIEEYEDAGQEINILNVATLSGLLYDQLDQDGNGIIEAQERERLERVLNLAQTTSVDYGKETSGTQKTRNRWNGRDYFVNFGAGECRVWSDARKYGFVCGGAGERYREAMERLEPGQRVFAYIPGDGYVGIGKVKDRAKRAEDFMVESNGDRVSLVDADTEGQIAERAASPENYDLFVPIDWGDTRARKDALWDELPKDKRMFFRLTSCKIYDKHREKVEEVLKHFDVPE